MLFVFDVIGQNLLVEVMLSPGCVASHAALKRNLVWNLHPNKQVDQIACPLIMEGLETFENDAINGFVVNLLCQDFQNKVIVQTLWIIPWQAPAFRFSSFEKRVLANDADSTRTRFNKKPFDAIALSVFCFAHKVRRAQDTLKAASQRCLATGAASRYSHNKGLLPGAGARRRCHASKH